MPYVETERGVHLYVEDVDPGAGSKPVLFIHGWPLNHRMFEYQFNVLPMYGYRCIGMDLRGFGQSGKPWTGYDYDRFSDDVRAVVEAFRLMDFALAGFSVGGAIAIRYMARHSGYGVSKLCLLAPAAPLFTRRPDYPYGITKEEVNSLLLQVLRDRPRMWTALANDYTAGAISAEYRNWFVDLGLQASGHGTYHTLAALRDEDVRGDLPQIRVPTGIFHGVQDKIVPYQSAVTLHQSIRGSELFRFEQSGHNVVYDELESFNRALLGFLDR